MNTNIHIYAPKATAKEKDIVDCPDCKKRNPSSKRKSLHLLFFSPWYGWERTCICCGRQWKDGEWMPLPFYPKARRDNISSAKQEWRDMPPVEKNHYGIEEPTNETR